MVENCYWIIRIGIVGVHCFSSMITSYEKFRIEDLKGEKDLLIEVNYSKNDEVKDCKTLKLTFPDGSQSFVKREHLFAFLFSIGTSDNQRDMVPEKLRHSRHYETVISVKAKKDIAKGELITFPLKITLPTIEEEVIGKAVDKEKSSLILPT